MELIGKMKLKEFVNEFGQPFSEMLGIDLKSRKKEEVLKWFLASILYARPIRESTATETYRLFEANDITTPKRILQTGWDGFVAILDEGGYTRYDFSTAERMLQIFANIQKDYDGDLNRLHASALDSSDLEERLKRLGKGIGPTTVAIFLRDLRGVWPKADPTPSPLVRSAMRTLKIRDLEAFSKVNHLDPIRLESALLRLGKDFLKKGRKVNISMN